MGFLPIDPKKCAASKHLFERAHIVMHSSYRGNKLSMRRDSIVEALLFSIELTSPSH